MNILFVERDRSRRRLFKDMLENAGATLIEWDVEDGPTGLPTRIVALALVEVRSRDDAPRLIARVKGVVHDSPPIIALVDAPDLVALCRQTGADEVLVEPVTMTALFEAIGRHLPDTSPEQG